MKKVTRIVIIFLLIGISCQNVERPEKPKDLIPEDKMTDVLYDVALIGALRSYSIRRLKTSGINPDTFLYKKHDIDSLQFQKSMSYYATQFNEFAAMWDTVAARLESKREEVGEAKRKQDSVQEADRMLEFKDRKKPENPSLNKGTDSLIPPPSE